MVYRCHGIFRAIVVIVVVRIAVEMMMMNLLRGSRRCDKDMRGSMIPPRVKSIVRTPEGGGMRERAWVRLISSLTSAHTRRVKAVGMGGMGHRGCWAKVRIRWVLRRLK